MKIALTGDVMLGRLVNSEVVAQSHLPPEVLWGDVLPLLLDSDLRLANLECVISSHGEPWLPSAKAFHFRAQPRAIEFLRAACIDCVTLANNHSLDYGAEALSECLALLDRAGIRRAGAGVDLAEALEAAWLAGPKGRVAVLGLTDNEPEWEAADRKPGVNYVAYDSGGLIEPYRSRLAKAIGRARMDALFVIISAHVGPNWGAPSPAMRALAHELLDLGADAYWGHSNHTPQGIELYTSKPVLYSTGDFVDDYAVHPSERNDLSFLFVLEAEGRRLARIRLYPVAIEDCLVRLARGDEVTFLRRQMQAKCAAFGSQLEFHDRVGTIEVA